MLLKLTGFQSKTEEGIFLSEYAAFKWSDSCLAEKKMGGVWVGEEVVCQKF